MTETKEVSPLERKIIRQVEYYFGDHNLPKDKFLQEEIKKEDGWVTMETMLKFKRLADLSSESNVVLAALKKSDSGLMEVSEEGDAAKIRRNPSLALPENNEEAIKERQTRTAYAKGFDKEATTLDELLEYFAQHEPSVVHISLRTYVKDKSKTRHFKGSVFMTFRDVESCQKFINAETYKYKDAELIRKFQKDYFEEKAVEIEEKRKKRGGGGNKDKKNGGQEGGDDTKENENNISLPKGTVLKINGLGGDITREDIKEMLTKEFEVNSDKEGGDIAFVTYERGGAEAKIRFKVENYAKPLLEKWNAKESVSLKDMALKASVLEGEEEEKFLADSLSDLKKIRSKNKGHKRKNFGKGPGGKRQRT